VVYLITFWVEQARYLVGSKLNKDADKNMLTFTSKDALACPFRNIFNICSDSMSPTTCDIKSLP